MKSRKRLLIIAGLCVVVAIAAVVQVFVKSRGDGTLVVFAPADRGIEVQIDGKAHALGAGGYVRVAAARGKHRVVAGGLAREVTVESGRHVVAVPGLATQCFVELDVTLSHYGDGGAPAVNRRLRRDAPFLLPPYALSEAELPKARTEIVRRRKVVGFQPVHLFRAEPCDPNATYDTRAL